MTDPRLAQILCTLAQFDDDKCLAQGLGQLLRSSMDAHMMEP